MTHLQYNRAASERECRRIMIEKAADAALKAHNSACERAARISAYLLLGVCASAAIIALVLL